MLTERPCRVNFSLDRWARRLLAFGARFGMVRKVPRFAAFAVLAFAACHSGLRDGVFVKDGRAYAIGDPPAAWKRVEIEDNDLAFINGDHSIAINSTCKDHGDPS